MYNFTVKELEDCLKSLEEKTKDISIREVVDEKNGYHYWVIPCSNGSLITGRKGIEEFKKAVVKAAKNYKYK